MGFQGAVLTGQSSRSPRTVEVHRRFRDGYATAEEFNQAIALDEAETIAAQVNFAFKTSGQLAWLDLLRPFALSFQGFEKRAAGGGDEVGPVTRWFRTNTFYRRPSVVAKLNCSGNELHPFLLQIENGIVICLGPYSFVKLVENKHYSDTDELAIDYCTSLAKCIFQLKEKGYKTMLLLEPVVGYDLSRNDFAIPSFYSDALNCLKGITTGVHFPLADGAKITSLVEPTAAAFIGIDCFYTQNPSAINTEKGLLLGVVDGNRAEVETSDAIARTVSRFLTSAKFSGDYYIGPNNRLYDVPFEIALQKIQALSKASKSIEGSSVR